MPNNVKPAQTIHDKMNYRTIELLKLHLRDFGYEAKKSRRKNVVLEITLKGATVSDLTKDGELLARNNYEQEQEKINGIVNFVLDYGDISLGFMGQQTLADFNNTILAVRLDKQTAKPLFYVYNAFENFSSDKKMEKRSYTNFEDAMKKYVDTIKQSLNVLCGALNKIPGTTVQYHLNIEDGSKS